MSFSPLSICYKEAKKRKVHYVECFCAIKLSYSFNSPTLEPPFIIAYTYLVLWRTCVYYYYIVITIILYTLGVIYNGNIKY